MVNTKKFYRIPRDKSDQAISLRAHDGECERAPDPGHKHQASSIKLFKRQALQASSDKLQAPSNKLQAASHKLQAPRFLNHGTCEQV